MAMMMATPATPVSDTSRSAWPTHMISWPRSPSRTSGMPTTTSPATTAEPALLTDTSPANRYPNAIADARESLVYKQQLCGEDSEIIAEAHFKLSLALEFASVTSQQDDEGAAEGAAAGPREVNQELRDEAAKELEAAINSTKLKLQNKEVELATLHSPEDNEISRKQITETKEIIADMEQRVSDPPHNWPDFHCS